MAGDVLAVMAVLGNDHGGDGGGRGQWDGGGAGASGTTVVLGTVVVLGTMVAETVRAEVEAIEEGRTRGGGRGRPWRGGDGTTATSDRMLQAAIWSRVETRGISIKKTGGNFSLQNVIF